MEINNIVGNALAGAFPRQKLIFTNTTVQWDTSSRRPKTIAETVILMGRLQPLNPQQLMQLGFSIQENEYYTVFVSNITPTQADRIKQLACSRFICNDETYEIVGKMPWDTNNWRQLYAYKILSGKNNG